jgi:excinuclease UvrABC ATPase subunit
MRYTTSNPATVVGVFDNPVGADNFAEACAQDFRDRGFTDDDFSFEVQMTTYYAT